MTEKCVHQIVLDNHNVPVPVNMMQQIRGPSNGVGQSKLILFPLVERLSNGIELIPENERGCKGRIPGGLPKAGNPGSSMCRSEEGKSRAVSLGFVPGQCFLCGNTIGIFPLRLTEEELVPLKSDESSVASDKSAECMLAIVGPDRGPVVRSPSGCSPQPESPIPTKFSPMVDCRGAMINRENCTQEITQAHCHSRCHIIQRSTSNLYPHVREIHAVEGTSGSQGRKSSRAPLMFQGPERRRSSLSASVST